MAGSRSATLHRRGKYFYVDYYRDDKRIQESTHTDNRKLAEEIRRKREREMFDGTEGIEREIVLALRDPARRDALLAVLKTGKIVSVDQSVTEYTDYCTSYKRAKTLYNDKRQVNKTLKAVGKVNLNEVTRKDLTDYLAERVRGGWDAGANKIRPGWAPASVQRWRETMHHFFGWAVKAGYLFSNPAEGIPRPCIPQKPIEYLRLNQIDKALEAVESDLIEAVVAMAIFAGPRREELTWVTTNGDVDFERRLIHIRSKCIDGEKWFPKTKRNRVVPISARLLPFLKAQQLRVGSGPWFFPSPKGTRWDPDNLSSRLRELMKKVGHSKWTFGIFRHTFGSLLAQKNLSDFKIAGFLGNSPDVVRKHYAELRPEEGHEEVEFAALEKQGETG